LKKKEYRWAAQYLRMKVEAGQNTVIILNTLQDVNPIK
jgi:hypothetical protein